MYEGSMYGAGIAVFAVWGWIISHARNGAVEINSKMLADTLGGEVKDIESAVGFLCKPDPRSRFKGHDGRRLVKDGEYQYLLPSWEEYNKIKKRADQQAYNAMKQRQYRAEKAIKNTPLRGERAFCEMQKRGEDTSLEPGGQILPDGLR